MLTLGELERSVMDLLWASGEKLTAYELQDRLRADDVDPKTPATTTLLTVLSRLEKKRFVSRERASRPHRYFAARTREEHMAELMHEVLGDATDSAAVLERFIGQASAREAAILRKLLGR